MDFWTWFWGLLLLVTLLLYAALVVYVAIGGFADIKQMFKTLSEDDRDHENEHAHEHRDSEADRNS